MSVMIPRSARRALRQVEDAILPAVLTRLHYVPRYTDWLDQYRWLELRDTQDVTLNWQGAGPSDEYNGCSYRVSEDFVACLHDVLVLGYPAVALRDRDIIMENSLSKPVNLRKSRFAVSLIRSAFSPIERIDCAVILTHLWSKNYYHWIIETLPRLRFIERTVPKITPRLLLNPAPTRWQIDSLTLLGFSPDQFVIQNERLKYLIGTTYVNSNMREIPVSGHKPAIIDWVRDRYRQAAAGHPDARPYPRRIYVSRQGAASRRLTNSAEFEQLLTGYGFEKIELERYSFLEQIQLFRGAEFVAGIHGAGLTNILFSDRTTLIEIFPSDLRGWHYANLCGILGFPYYPYLAGGEAGHVTVDLREFEARYASLF